ncbi:MAG: dephospho-CoA kinase [Gammaproteobacteria bacterium]|nr:dephospho-CoA kinase [Gammaproteobacteria bacterium]
MLTIALTGGIGSGKTQVSDYFSSLGAPVIDTDIISRQLVEPGQPALKQIAGYFGHQLLLDSGELDRAGLREIIFNNSTARKTLEDILHPAIRDKVQQQLEASTYPYVIIVIPLYVETGQFLKTDRILVVDCPQEIQKKRVLARDNISIEQIGKILQSQATREQRLAVADDVIVNDSDIETLQRKVKLLHEHYLHTRLIK